MNAADQLTEDYARLLEDYLRSPGESVLAKAYELGRQALATEIGVLGLVASQHQALCRVLGASMPGESRPRLEAALSVLLESVLPFEITHRGAQQANLALRRLNGILEEEVKRIAHLLHGEAGQLLAAVHIALEEFARELSPEERGPIQKIREFLDQIEVQLRRLSHELHPTVLDDLGLLPALHFLSEGFAKRTGLQITVSGSTEERLPSSVETTLYRVVQEALNNVSKHARAVQVTIELWREGDLILCRVRDDGVGFDAGQVLTRKGERGLGLVVIRERLNPLGGTFKLSSAPGKGTDLLVSIPLEKQHGHPGPPGR